MLSNYIRFMKNIFMFIVSALLMVSCGENIEFNNPAFQSKKDGNLWRAQSYGADIDNGAILVRGRFNSETVWLLPDNDNRATYVLGANNISEARYIDENGLVYSTKYTPDPSVQVYPAEGQIIIESFERVDGANRAITGTFWFNAFTADGLQRINFNQGHFYRVPLTGGLDINVIVSCDQAVTASGSALEVYQATDTMSAEFYTVCNTYKAALMQQITSCGDETNALQDIINGLDCGTEIVPGGCQTCTGGVAPATEYCDNGDGTMSVTISGFPATNLDLAGTSFNDYITGLESSGLTCD